MDTSRVPGVIARSKAASTASESPPMAQIGDRQIHSPPLAQCPERPERARVLQARSDRPVARLPVDRPRRDVHPVGGGMGQRDARRARSEDRRNRCPRLRHPLERVPPVVGVRAAGSKFPRLGLGHRPGRLARQRPGAAGVEVDAGGRGREGLAQGGDLLVVGEKRGYHVRDLYLAARGQVAR